MHDYVWNWNKSSGYWHSQSLEIKSTTCKHISASSLLYHPDPSPIVACDVCKPIIKHGGSDFTNRRTFTVLSRCARCRGWIPTKQTNNLTAGQPPWRHHYLHRGRRESCEGKRERMFISYKTKQSLPLSAVTTCITARCAINRSAIYHKPCETCHVINRNGTSQRDNFKNFPSDFSYKESVEPN